MANILTPFGFKHLGNVGIGMAPSYEMRQRKIALGNTNPIFHGDPVTSLSTGYIQQAVTGAGVQIAGVFQGCEYFSISQQRKVRSPYWPGSDAQFDVDAFIIDAAFSQFYVAADAGPVTFASIDNNADITIATGGSTTPVAGSGQGNTINGFSGALLKFSNIGTSAAFPFRIIRLYSDFVAPGAPNAGTTSFPGADNTTAFNWVIVAFNNVDAKSLTGI
jgi:hypothetical protein